MVGSLDDLSCQIKNSCVFNMNDAAVRAWFNLDIGDVAFAVFFRPKIIANGLFVNIQL